MQVISPQTSDSLSFWVSDDLSNNYWGQVGYFISGGGAPIAFFQVWNLNTSVIEFEGSTPTSDGFHAFSMFLKNGTTWDYAVDGLVFGSFDMHASTSSSTYPVYALSEEQTNTTYTFPTVMFDPALQVLRSGSWDLVGSANSYGSAWGIQGTDQNSSLARGEVVLGGNLSLIPAGSRLWSYPPPPTNEVAPGTISAISSPGQFSVRKSD